MISQTDVEQGPHTIIALCYIVSKICFLTKQK